MFDLIKKTLLTGNDLTTITREKIEKLASEMIEEGKLSIKEGKELVDEMIKRSEQARKDLETKIEGSVRKTIKKMDLASKKVVAGLVERIERLEKKKPDRKE